MKPLGPTDPQRVGRYRLLGKLGAGGMGSVYLARSDRGRTVAVKLVQPELAAQPEFRQRFQHEVEAARRVGGEWTAPVLDADTEAATPWVATGYVAGPALHDVVTNSYGPLPERTLFILADGLVKALRDIHGAGLVHRDLKPSNVMITLDGPRVIDFGIARALESGEGLTRTGAAVGSPGFMSPEQCRGETLTPASDIFCLGSVLTFAATGRTPFGDANSSMTALMLAIVQGQYDLDGVPDDIRQLIEACLAQDPTQRPTLDQLHQHTDIPDDSGEPWLPGALVAQLGRHAVGLLDSEDPTGDTVIGQPPVGPPAMPPTSLPTAAGAPGYGYPQVSPPHGYGYPQTASPLPPGPYGPGMPTGTPPPKRNNTPWIVAATIAVVAIATGVAIAASSGGDDRADGDPAPTPTVEQPDPTPEPTEDPTEEPTEEPTHEPTGGTGNTVGAAFLGAWEGEADVTNSEGEEAPWHFRFEIAQGAEGDRVAVVRTLLSGVLCTEEAELVTGGNDRLAIRGAETTGALPSEGTTCDPFGDQTLTVQNDGTLLWSIGNLSVPLEESSLAPNSDGMPADIFASRYQADGLQITTEFGPSSGELAFTFQSDECTWESVLVTTDSAARTMLISPGQTVSGDCDPLLAYEVTWDEAELLSYSETITLTPFAGDDAEITAEFVE